MKRFSTSNMISMGAIFLWRKKIGIKIIYVLCLAFFILTMYSLSVRSGSDLQIPQTCPSEVYQKSKILNEKNVRVLPYSPNRTNEQLSALIEKEFECVDMLLPDHSSTYKMCIYDPKQDLVISNNIKIFGAWEKDNVAEMLKAFQIFPDLVLVDLGSNVGAFTLPAALTGAQVIAVDALKENHLLLHQSLIKNNLLCKVTLIHNAIYNKRGPMKITMNSANIGGSEVAKIPNFSLRNVHTRNKVDAICLDDLIPLIKGKNIFLKMDIEGSEEAAFECAHQLFKKVNVKVLLMEWLYYRHNEKASSKIKTFLETHGMVPTWGIDRNRVIDLSASDMWPENVFWMEK